MSQWPIESQHQNLTEILWWDLKRAAHKRMSTKLSELKQRCKNERAKLFLQQFQRATTSLLFIYLLYSDTVFT